jgi:hypothetical protein
MKTLLRLSCSLAALALLGACGGGGGGGPLSTPLPPPPPPPPNYSSFAAQSGNQQVPLSGVVLSRIDTSPPSGHITGDTAVTPAPFSDGRLEISYDAADNSYTVRDGTYSQEFLPADIRITDGTNGPAFVNYVRNPGTRNSDYLSLYRPSGGGGDVALTYTTLAMSTRIAITDSADGKTTTTRTDAFWGMGGFETVASDMPRTGTASYLGVLRGFSFDGPTTLNVSGQSRLTADFAAATVRAELFANRAGFSTLLLDGTGAIAAARFGGTITGGGFSGAFDGAFFGPSAAEIGFSFTTSDSAGRRIVGVGAGRR